MRKYFSCIDSYIGLILIARDLPLERIELLRYNILTADIHAKC